MRSSRGSGESQATPRHSSSSQDIDQGYQILVSFVSAASGGSASAPPFHVNEDCLFHVFSRFGAVLDVLVKQYTHSTTSAGPPPPGYPHAHERPATLHKQCGYGFVLFEDWAAAQQAMTATRLDPQGDQTLGIKLDCRLSTLTAQKLRREGVVVVVDDAAAGAPDHASHRTKAPKQQPPHHSQHLPPQPQPQPQQLAGYTSVTFSSAPQPPQMLPSPYGYAVYGGPASSGPPSSSSSPLQAPWPQAPGSSPPSASSSSSNSPPPAALHASNTAAFAYATAYAPQWQLSPHSAATGSGGGSPPPPPPPSYASSPSLLYVPVQLQPPHVQQMQQYQQLQQYQQYQQLQQLRQMQQYHQLQQSFQAQQFQSQAPITQQPQPHPQPQPQGYAVAPSHSVYAAAAYASHGQPPPSR